MNENIQPQPDFHNNHFFLENEKSVLLDIAKKEIKKEAEEILGINSLKRKLFEDCFEELGLLGDGKVYSLNELKGINGQIFNALEQVYTEEVIIEFLQQQENKN